MSSEVLIHTHRLLLRPLQPGDVDALFAIFGDPEAMRYWSSPPWTSAEPGREMLARDQAAGADADHLRLGLVLPDDNRLIGTCTLFDHQRQCRRAEVGYILARDCWGQGLMHEALSALLDHGFEHWNLNRVEADIDPRNQGSARILQSLGFVQEGHLRERWIVGGEVSDSALFGLLRRDWAGRTRRP